MAARIPPIQTRVLNPDGTMSPAWHRFLQDLSTRLGGAADLTLSADDTGYTVTFLEPDSTAHSKTTAW